MMKNEPMATGKKANTPKKYVPGKIGPSELDALDGACDAKTAGDKNRNRIDNYIQYDCTRCAPVHQPQQEHGAKPN